ncbi:MAG TPA: hypothetical protein VF316_05040, partial [Polyangiaceae bacterium]
DGASLRQALLGLFGQRTRKKKPPQKRTSQTGSVRVSVVPPSSGTGSYVLTPTPSPPSAPPASASVVPPPAESLPLVDAKPPRPMAKAKPIATPAPESVNEPDSSPHALGGTSSED